MSEWKFLLFKSKYLDQYSARDMCAKENIVKPPTKSANKGNFAIRVYELAQTS